MTYLTITTYVDRDAELVETHVEEALGEAVAAAGERVAAGAAHTRTERTDTGLTVRTDLDLLDGTELGWERIDGLTELRLVIPWRDGTESHNRRSLAANRLATALSEHILAA